MRSFDPQKTGKEIVTFLKKEFKSAGFTQGIVALSGGIDSAVTAFLTARALGVTNTYLLMLPYRDWHTEAVAHGELVVAALKIPKKNVSIVDIAPMVDVYRESPKFETRNSKLRTNTDRIRLGNFMARMRMSVLYDYAKRLSALVVGTENLSEYYLSYFTRFGDEASDIEAIRTLFKTEVFALAKHFSVPQEILNKPPSANLWKGQTDEDEFGFTYKEADEVLYQLYVQKKTDAAVVRSGFSKELVGKIKKWVEKNEFKHHLPKVMK